MNFIFVFPLDGDYLSFIELNDIKSVELPVTLDSKSNNITISDAFPFGSRNATSLSVSHQDKLPSSMYKMTNSLSTIPLTKQGGEVIHQYHSPACSNMHLAIMLQIPSLTGMW